MKKTTGCGKGCSLCISPQNSGKTEMVSKNAYAALEIMPVKMKNLNGH